jgi:hypothetical protein
MASLSAGGRVLKPLERARGNECVGIGRRHPPEVGLGLLPRTGLRRECPEDAQERVGVGPLPRDSFDELGLRFHS